MTSPCNKGGDRDAIKNNLGLIFKILTLNEYNFSLCTNYQLSWQYEVRGTGTLGISVTYC